MKVKYLILLPFIAACAGNSEITTPPVDLVPTDASRAQKGNSAVAVRSYNGPNAHRKKELVGAQCTVASNDFTGSFTTPAIINIPNYGANSKAFQVQCQAGERSAITNAIPYNVTQAQRASNAQVAGGLIGWAIASAINAASDESEDQFGYHNISVQFPEQEASEEASE